MSNVTASASARIAPSFMHKSEWEAPVDLKVGDVAVVLYAPHARRKDTHLLDVDSQPGSTVVVDIESDGTVVLANGDKFYKNGYGHKKNKNLVLSKCHALNRDNKGHIPEVNGVQVVTPAVRDGHYSTF